MVIKASSSREIESLVADLSAESAIKRDSAIARLTIIGPRAVERLITLATNKRAGSPGRVAALRALERIAEPRALPVALELFADPDPAIAAAALNATRPFLKASRGVEALDRVIAVALDHGRPLPVRVAAIQALGELPDEDVRPVRAALKSDPSPEIVNLVEPPRRRAAVNPLQRLEAAAAGALPPEANVLRSAILRSAADAPVSTLLELIEQIRIREGAEPTERRPAWRAARAAAHLSLAQRGSRLALFDLRETIESAGDRLPVEFFAAVTTIGDASCLEPIAGAYVRTTDEWSRRQLADAFRAIVSREKTTRRHAVAKKIEKRSPGTWEALIR